MTRLGSIPVLAFLLRTFLLVGALDTLPKEKSAPLLARPRIDQAVSLHIAAAPAPALAVATSDACSGTCADAKKMWKQAEETQKVAIDLEKKRAEDRIEAEADVLVAEAKQKVEANAMTQKVAMEGHVKGYMDGRIQTFQTAVASRRDQAVLMEAQKFEKLKLHQSQLMDGLLSDVVDHGYDVARQTVEKEASVAGAGFHENEKMAAATASLKKAAEEWSNTYHESDVASRDSYATWSGAYDGLTAPWKNITDAFDLANNAAQAANGLGPDTRWANELVRISGDVVQAANTEAHRQSSEADMAFGMASKADKIVKGNSGSILTLTDLISTAESQANSASIAR